MKTYSMTDRLPDLSPSPREAGYECNSCGELFDLPPVRHRDPEGEDDRCVLCGSKDIHRG